MATYVIQILAGIATGAILFLVASGLTLVFGALRIANFAHGSLYMLGAFLMVTIMGEIGTSDATFFAFLILVALAIALGGAIMEIVFLRPIYRRPPLTQLIVTFGLVLLIGGIVRVVWGPVPTRGEVPPILVGSVQILGRGFPIYQLFLIGLAAGVALVLWAILYRTSMGRMIRAAVSDRELLELSGVNVRWLFTGVFMLGAFFAGLAGAAVPAQGAAVLGMDIEVIVKAFVVIVIGGMGSLAGALVGSLLVGIAESLGVLWIPDASLVLVFGVLVLVLAVRPQGLFGKVDIFSAARATISGGRRFRLLRASDDAAGSRAMTNRGLWGLALLATILAALAPFFLDVGMILVATSALVFGLFALSLNLLLGTGLISFGHALFFGFGAYGTAVAVAEAGWPPLVGLALAPALGAAVAVVSGVIALRATELYFALLTLGIAQIAFAGALGWDDLTGGTNGLVGAFAPAWLLEPNRMYWFVFGCTLVCSVVLLIITRSPFGDALHGIRDNRRRAEFTGLWVKRYELTAYVVAGTIASIAGSLFAISQLQAHVDLFHWRTSALPVIMTLLGGMGAFLGPMVGSFGYTFLNDFVSERTEYWDLIIGGIVVIVAIAMPAGICGVIRTATSAVVSEISFRSRRRRDTSEPINAKRPLSWRGRAQEQGLDGLPSTSENTEADFGTTQNSGYRETGRVARSKVGSGQKSHGDIMLRVENLSKAFGGLAAVSEVSFDVRRGDLHAIIGPNGAGKTTLFNLITGLMKPDEGRVLFEGVDVTNVAPWRRVKRGVGRSFQQASLFWDLSAFTNVTLAESSVRDITLRMYGGHPSAVRTRARQLLTRLGLDQLADVSAREISHGDQRALEIALALAVESKLLLLDEPTAGLSPAETREAVAVLTAIAESEGFTVLFVEHDMDVVFRVADKITVLAEGRVLAEGTPETIRASPDVKSAYLGTEGTSLDVSS